MPRHSREIVEELLCQIEGALGQAAQAQLELTMLRRDIVAVQAALLSRGPAAGGHQSATPELRKENGCNDETDRNIQAYS